MKLAIAWGPSGPIVRKPGTCESCGQPFACELSLSGCWCSTMRLAEAARAQLRAQFKNCLCPACLKKYESAEPGGSSDVLKGVG